MGGNQCERIIRTYLDIHFAKAATDLKAAATQQEIVIRARSPGGNGKSAENGDVNVGIVSRNKLPLRQIQSAIFERVA